MIKLERPSYPLVSVLFIVIVVMIISFLTRELTSRAYQVFILYFDRIIAHIGKVFNGANDDPNERTSYRQVFKKYADHL